MAAAVDSVRLVRCPKCKMLLPEIPNIPVYQCGGCNITLQARASVRTKPRTDSNDARNKSLGEDKTINQTEGSAKFKEIDTVGVDKQINQNEDSVNLKENDTLGVDKQRNQNEGTVNSKENEKPIEEESLKVPQREIPSNGKSSSKVNDIHEEEDMYKQVVEKRENRKGCCAENNITKHETEISTAANVDNENETCSQSNKSDQSSYFIRSDVSVPFSSSGEISPTVKDFHGRMLHSKRTEEVPKSSYGDSPRRGITYESLAAVVRGTENEIQKVDAERKPPQLEVGSYVNVKREVRNAGVSKVKETSKSGDRSTLVKDHHYETLNAMLSKSESIELSQEIDNVSDNNSHFVIRNATPRVGHTRVGQTDLYSKQRVIPFVEEDEYEMEYQHNAGVARDDGTAHVLDHVMGERLELLKKLDDLREQVRRQCDISSATNEHHHKSFARTKQVLGYNYPHMNRKLHHGYEDNAWEDDIVCSDEMPEHIPYISKVDHCKIHGYHGCVHCSMEENSAKAPSTYGKSYLDPYNDRYGLPSRFSKLGGVHSHSHVSTFEDKQAEISNRQYNTSYHPSMELMHNCESCSINRLHNRSAYSHELPNWGGRLRPSKMPPVAFSHQRGGSIPNESILLHKNFHIHDPYTCSQPRQLYSQQQILASNEKMHSRSCPMEDGKPLHGQNLRLKESLASKWERSPYAPFAGATPFVLCDNCLQLLIIPQKLRTIRKKKYKLQCGKCFHVFEFSIQKRKKHSLALCDKPPLTGNQCKDEDYENEDVECNNSPSPKELPVTQHYSFGPRESVAPNKNYNLDLRESVEPINLMHPGVNAYSSAQRNQKLQSPDRNTDTNRLQHPNRGSPLHEHLGYSSPSDMINKCFEERLSLNNRISEDWDNEGSENISTKINRPHLLPKKGMVAAAPTKGTGASEEFVEKENQDTLSRDSSRNRNSSLTGFIKKSIRDFKRGNHGSESSKPKVSINGRPVPDGLVKRAEQNAGPIDPGDYWYDYYAGFWGIMGDRCLGIVPPFIEEFNYPMPRDCAGGNTRVLVNGRELHVDDLRLLVARGLPSAKDKSYQVEINGRVVDKATNSELRSLGKLAPTLEKMGRGVGMKPLKKKP